MTRWRLWWCSQATLALLVYIVLDRAGGPLYRWYLAKEVNRQYLVPNLWQRLADAAPMGGFTLSFLAAAMALTWVVRRWRLDAMAVALMELTIVLALLAWVLFRLTVGSDFSVSTT